MALKPMNCPAHFQLFAQRRSYRDLPVRYSEPGLLHRHEPSGDAARPAARPPLHPGRRPHLLHRGADPGRGRRAAWTSPSPCTRCSASSRGSSCRRGPSKRIGSDEMWDRAEAALEQRARRQGPRVRAQPGRRRVLRPEDRPAHDRLARPLLAARHRAARLQHARALRAHLHGRRQRRAPPGDDPPRADGLLRALHRDPASSTSPASCRCGSRRCRRSCCRSPTATTTYAGQVVARLRAPALRARGRRPHRVGRAARSATRSCARSRTCWSSATARQDGRRSRCASTAGRRAIRGSSSSACDGAVERRVGRAPPIADRSLRRRIAGYTRFVDRFLHPTRPRPA